MYVKLLDLYAFLSVSISASDIPINKIGLIVVGLGLVLVSGRDVASGIDNLY